MLPEYDHTMRGGGRGRQRMELAYTASLAGCAFKAYTDPPLHVGYTQRDSEDTYTTFTSPRFVKDHFDGVLALIIRDVAFLPGKKIARAADDYDNDAWETMAIVRGPMLTSDVVLAISDAHSEPAMLYYRIPDATAEAEANPDGERTSLRVSFYRRRRNHTTSRLRKMIAFAAHGSTQQQQQQQQQQEDDSHCSEFLGVTEPLAMLALADGNLCYHRDDVKMTCADQQCVGSVKLSMEVTTAFRGRAPQPQPQRLLGSGSSAEDEDTGPRAGIIRTAVSAMRSAFLYAWNCQWQIPQWRSLAMDAGTRCVWEPVMFIDDRRRDTQAWVFLDAEHRAAVISFRGTEGWKLFDVLTDIQLLQTAWACEEGGRTNDSVRSLVAEVRVHHGFSVAYEAVRARVRNILTALAERGQRLDSVHVTGHSMGAALATLCALDLVTSPPRGISCERTLVCACTFGSPRVGNAAFATLFGAMVPCSVRVKTPYDVVPSLPPESVFAQKYVHVKGGVVILRDGNCAACSDEEEGEDDCVQHLTDPNWVDSLRAARLVDEQATRRNPGVLNTLASLAYRTVMGGSVIDHLPAMYYFNLQRVVWRALRDKARATVVGNG